MVLGESLRHGRCRHRPRLRLFVFHRLPLLTAESRRIVSRGRRSGALRKQFVVLRSRRGDLSLRVTKLLPDTLDLACEAVCPGIRSVERRLGSFASSEGVAQLPLEHATLDVQLVDAGVLLRQSLAVGPSALRLVRPLPRAATPSWLGGRLRRRHGNNRTSRKLISAPRA